MGFHNMSHVNFNRSFYMQFVLAIFVFLFGGYLFYVQKGNIERQKRIGDIFGSSLSEIHKSSVDSIIPSSRVSSLDDKFKVLVSKIRFKDSDAYVSKLSREARESVLEDNLTRLERISFEVDRLLSLVDLDCRLYAKVREDGVPASVLNDVSGESQYFFYCLSVGKGNFEHVLNGKVYHEVDLNLSLQSSNPFPNSVVSWLRDNNYYYGYKPKGGFYVEFSTSDLSGILSVKM